MFYRYLLTPEHGQETGLTQGQKALSISRASFISYFCFLFGNSIAARLNVAKQEIKIPQMKHHCGIFYLTANTNYRYSARHRRSSKPGLLVQPLV